MLEANGDSYSGYERVSASTGLPTVLGWYVHEWLWRNDVPDLNQKSADIQTIYTNGGKAYELYCKYIYPANGIKAHKLPSTSPANAGYSLDRLKEAWAEIKE